MKQYRYEGTDRKGRPTSGSTVAESAEEVKKQLAKFGFRNVRIEEEASSPDISPGPSQAQEQSPDDAVRKLVGGDVEIEDQVAAIEEEEAEEDEWRRADTIARVRRFRRRENVAMVISLVIVAVLVAYFIYEKITKIEAPQPHIVLHTRSEMLTLKDVYVKGNELYFRVFSRNWNGNVKVDFEAYDVFDFKADSGTARLGFIGEYYGGVSEKTNSFKLRENRFYERIEVTVSGDEGK